MAIAKEIGRFSMSHDLESMLWFEQKVTCKLNYLKLISLGLSPFPKMAHWQKIRIFQLQACHGKMSEVCVVPQLLNVQCIGWRLDDICEDFHSALSLHQKNKRKLASEKNPQNMCVNCIVVLLQLGFMSGAKVTFLRLPASPKDCDK